MHLDGPSCFCLPRCLRVYLETSDRSEHTVDCHSDEEHVCQLGFFRSAESTLLCVPLLAFRTVEQSHSLWSFGNQSTQDTFPPALFGGKTAHGRKGLCRRFRTGAVSSLLPVTDNRHYMLPAL